MTPTIHNIARFLHMMKYHPVFKSRFAAKYHASDIRTFSGLDWECEFMNRISDEDIAQIPASSASYRAN